MKPAQAKPPISPDLLNQIDVRVGTILTVTDVANSEKLVALEVSFGDHRRTVLAGMKRERADPREIEGKQALFVVNLAPRKMAGMVSEGWSPKECSSTSVTRTELLRCWQCPKRMCRTELEGDDAHRPLTRGTNREEYRSRRFWRSIR
jgi:tRNA-binding protein